MSLFNCLPVVDKPILFTTLQDACYCSALFSFFGLFDYTVGPLTSLAEFCYEEESYWQAMTRYCGYIVQIATLLLFVCSMFYIIGIKQKKRRFIICFMYFVCTTLIVVAIHTVLLLAINIIYNDTECDYPNIKSKDVVVRTSIKVVTTMFFFTIYLYVLIITKSYYVTFPPEKKKDIESAALKIKDSASGSKKSYEASTSGNKKLFSCI